MRSRRPIGSTTSFKSRCILLWSCALLLLTSEATKGRDSIRANVLHGGRYGGKTWSGGPNIGSEADRQSMLLVLRVISIVPLNYNVGRHCYLGNS
jgi:hypothetical protein